MTTQLKSKPGITGATVRSIPEEWDPAWFRGFINNLLKGADVRNAVSDGSVTVSGNIASPYATISINLTNTSTGSPSAGGAGALPATPAGYATVMVNGAPRKIAYY
jgi:hypothetical protein